MLAEFGTFCDEAQAVKVHIGAGENPDESLVFAAVLLDVVFNACDRKGAGRFKNASRILEDVLVAAQTSSVSTSTIPSTKFLQSS